MVSHISHTIIKEVILLYMIRSTDVKNLTKRSNEETSFSWSRTLITIIEKGLKLIFLTLFDYTPCLTL